MKMIHRKQWHTQHLPHTTLALRVTAEPAGRTMACMHQCDGNDLWPLCCHRCGSELRPGEGNFYLVRIEAVADPTPPNFSEEDLWRDPKAEMQRLLEQMRDLSAQEAMDQVYRRLMLYLCGPCYRHWIENPVGEKAEG